MQLQMISAHGRPRMRWIDNFIWFMHLQLTCFAETCRPVVLGMTSSNGDMHPWLIDWLNFYFYIVSAREVPGPQSMPHLHTRGYRDSRSLWARNLPVPERTRLLPQAGDWRTKIIQLPATTPVCIDWLTDWLIDLKEIIILIIWAW